MRPARTPLPTGALRITFFPGGFLPDGETVECPDIHALTRALSAVARPEKARSCGWGPYSLDCSRRSNEAVEELWLDVIDIDGQGHTGATPEEWAQITAVLAHYRYAWHYTHSHNPVTGRIRARILIPLARPVLKVDWKTYRKGTPWAQWHDPATNDVSHFYYCPPLGAEITFHDGETVDPYTLIDDSTRGYESKIARIGDGLGRKGFQGTIVPAIAAYVRAGRDISHAAIERLKEDIRERIDAAPKAFDRSAADVERYKTDGFLDDAIRGALEKFNPARPPLPVAPYSEIELAQIAAADGIDTETLMGRLILCRGGIRYIRRDDTYQAVSILDVATAVRHNCAKYPIQWRTENGKMKGRDALEQSHATHISNVLYDARIDRTAVEPHNGELRLRVACGVLRPNLKPVFSSAVDSWINSTSNPGALRAWMGDVYNLDRALFALILWGPPGTGKSSFAEGIARAWGDAATKASTVFPGAGKTAWTAPLVDCPLVFADEQAPDCSVRRLREFLGSDTHSLTRKFESEALFLGYPRLIIAGHDERVGLRLTDAAPDEIAGTATRFQSVYVPSGPRIDWGHFVRDYGLAQHALWLRANASVARDANGMRHRFGLPPDDSFAKMLSVSGDAPNRVLQWLASALSNPSAVQCVQRIWIPDIGYAPLMGAQTPGHLLLAPDKISKAWNNLSDAPQRPTLAEIRASLRTICRPLHLAGRDVLVLLPDIVRQWCREFGADEPAALRWVI